ncbi:hypothetical protein [Flavobacterium sp. B183]|nr:hypothetical protein [Flavobacterium sp. B183]URC13963.1 hypothetical protein M4I44_06075 [Flavobacterium sp. B183]URC14016.1 hypothetical protein M4I44_06405 [Flavobacterium sp. B183]
MHKKIPKKPLDKSETIWETEARLKKEAIEISKNFIHTKPTKFLLK